MVNIFKIITSLRGEGDVTFCAMFSCIYQMEIGLLISDMQEVKVFGEKTREEVGRYKLT